MYLVLTPAVVLSDCVPGIDNNTNYRGNDLPGHSDGWQVANHEDCCDRCNADPDCLYYTFCESCTCKHANSSARGCCHPKTSKAGATKGETGRISGRSTNPIPTPAPPAPMTAKNVLFILADDLRPNLMKAYGQTYMKTPNMDRLAAKSLIFKRAYVQQQVCSPSRNRCVFVCVRIDIKSN